MSYYKKFPIYNDTMNMVLLIEQTIKSFPRYHKYAIGSKIHNNAYDALDAITYSLNNKTTRIQSIQKARNFIEILKTKISLAKNITNLSFKAFDNIAILLIKISKQCRAWLKHLQHQRSSANNYV